MIIGISGKIGSGKDTVGEIIKILSSFPNMSEDDVVLCLEKVWYNNKFEIKKFADKLKDIVCILIGCTRSQLEDREFKEKELGEEWWYWKVFSNIRDDKFELIPYNGEKGLYDRKANYKGHLLKKLTPRLLLQLLGTECGRNIIHPNIWVNALMSDYKARNKGKAHDLKDYSELYLHQACGSCGKSYSGWKRQDLCKDCIEDTKIQFYPNWIITDMRFPNELEAVKSNGGITIRVERSVEDIAYQLAVQKFGKDFKRDMLNKETVSDIQNYVKKAEHISEAALDEAEFDYTIINEGTLEDLVIKVKTILKELNII